MINPRTNFDLAIVGSGPGGYVAAIRASKMGLKTALIEENEIGGICLNWGCIPSKALLKNADVINLFKRAEEFGVTFSDLDYNFSKGLARSRQVVQRLVRGINFLLKKNAVTVLKGRAQIKDTKTIEINMADNTTTISANKIIIATGASHKNISGIEPDGDTIITSREALESPVVPASILILGGGATGVEFSYIYSTYGSDVTIAETRDHILPNEDQEISILLESSLQKIGVNIVTSSKVLSISRTETHLIVQLETTDGVQTVKVEKLLIAAGIVGNTSNIGLENVGLIPKDTFIEVDPRMQTIVDGIYAIGDVTGLLPLAHVASAQAIIAIDDILGNPTDPLDYIYIPKATYSNPQVASFGHSERTAKESGLSVNIGRFPFRANGKALAIGESEGLIKVLFNPINGSIVGAHMLGSDVTELLATISMTNKLDGNFEDLSEMTYAHPTLSEIIKESAMEALGKSIHI